MKVEKLNGYLSEKTNEYDELYRDFEKNKKSLKEL